MSKKDLFLPIYTKNDLAIFHQSFLDPPELIINDISFKFSKGRTNKEHKNNQVKKRIVCSSNTSVFLLKKQLKQYKKLLNP